MTRPSRIVKRLALPIAIVVTLIVAAVVFAQPPTASFVVNAPPGNTCGLYSFTSSSSDPDNDIQSQTWDIAGTGADGPIASATFGTPGTRTVALTVTDAAGGDDTTIDTDVETQQVNVVNAGNPTADISTSPANPVQPGATVTVTATGADTGGSGSVASYQFDLDGNNVYEVSNTTGTATTSFTVAGSHTVRARTVDNCGAQSDPAVTSVFVQNTPPTASFTFAPNPGAIGEAMTFDANASSDDTTRYEWSFDGDDTVFEVDGAASPTTTHTFAAGGSYLVYLRVTDAEGASTITNRLVRVNTAPTASFLANPNPALIGEAVSFDASSSRDSDGTIASYQWDLDGDGTFETTQAAATPAPTRTYAAAGTVPVKLRVTDNNGAFEEFTRDVVVQATRPNPGFTYEPRYPLPGQAVTLTSTSTPSASPGAPSLIATQWDFSYSPLADFSLDGAGASIVTSFATAGPHPVAVKVTETGGGFAIANDTIVVNAPPRAAFTVTPSKPTAGRSVTFASTSSDPDGPLVKQEWDFNNDGKWDRNGSVVSTSSLKAGTRLVRLRVTDDRGAAATASVPVKVARKPLKPVPDIASTVRWSARPGGIRLVALIVVVPSNTFVTVSCKGSGCPKGSFRKHSKKKKRGRLVFTQLRRNLNAGARIDIVFRRPGYVTGWDTVKVRGRGEDRVVQLEGCKLGTAKKQKRCPR